MERRYPFSWELLGGLNEGRPTLGRYARLEAYRLMQYTMRDVLEERLGTQQTEGLFYQAGQLAGKEFYQHMIGETHEGQWLLRRLQQVLREMGLGLLHLEEVAPDNSRFVFVLKEDLDCSGGPTKGHSSCYFDAGVFSGVLEAFFQQPYDVVETECWSLGDERCRFEATLGQGLGQAFSDSSLVHG